jgi:glycosyltransferase involved in cell wall biosynthesis
MRVLLVSYHLYPDGTAEGLCVAKTARTLLDAGHEVTVITRSQSGGPESAGGAAQRFLSGVRICPVAADAALVPGWTAPFYRMSTAGWGGAVGNFVTGRASAAPNLILGCNRDEYAWVAAAANRIVGVWSQAQTRFDVIYSRLNHSVSHMAVLSALPRLSPPAPWCAHFSDPWPHHLYPPPYRSRVGPLFRIRLEGILGRILSHAGSLTFPGDRLMRFLLSGERENYRGKAHVVPHLGNLWPAPESAPDNGKFTILFAGFLLKQRSPAAFFSALRLLFGRRPEARQALLVRFMGNSSAPLRDLICEYGFQDLVISTPLTSFEEAWEMMRRSHVLLLIESRMEEGIFMPSKLADYLSARRPILALSPPVGTVADLLALGGGLRADPDDPEQIAAALDELYQRWRSGRLEELRPSAALAEYVSPSMVAPAYEAAFRQAAAAAGGIQ